MGIPHYCGRDSPNLIFPIRTQTIKFLTPPQLNDIDRLVHEPAGLMILANLYVVESADFTFLMNQTGLTWGNLSSHLSKLEEAGYVQIEKEFVDKKPHTMLSLTGQVAKPFSITASRCGSLCRGSWIDFVPCKGKA